MVKSHPPRTLALPTQDENQACLEKFSSINVGAQLANIHTLGCPVYTLQNALQGGSSTPKWNPWCRLGIYLGPSPFHVQNMYLVLNPSTCLASPRYHMTSSKLSRTAGTVRMYL